MLVLVRNMVGVVIAGDGRIPQSLASLTLTPVDMVL